MGRLIDADELKRNVLKWMPKDQSDYMDSAIPPLENLTVSMVMEIDDAPTVDAVPVRHAHWIRHEYADIVDGYLVPEFECSECHSWKKDDSDYCPDCGAKMDGENGEHEKAN